MQKKVSFGWGKERMGAKRDWLLSLSAAERYDVMVQFGDFFSSVRKEKINLNDWRSYKTIQILKQK